MVLKNDYIVLLKNPIYKCACNQMKRSVFCVKYIKLYGIYMAYKYNWKIGQKVIKCLTI